MNNRLPLGWAWSTIGDVCLPVEKTDPRTTPDSEFEYIDIGGVGSGTRQITETRSLVGRSAPSRARQVVRTNDIVLATVRTYQKKTAIVPSILDKAIASTGFSILRPVSDIDPLFLLFQVTTDEFVTLLSARQTGTSYPAVRDKDVKAMPLRVAPRFEQRRIVRRVEDILSRLDRVEVTLKSLKTKLNLLRSSILVDAFHAARTLPKSWRWAKLGQLCKKPQYGWTTKSVPTDGLPYLRITDISSGNVDWSSVPSCVNSPTNIEKFLLKDGDIVVSRSGASVGFSHILRDPPKAVFASYLIRLRVSENLLPEYLAFYLQSPTYWNTISDNKIGSAIPNVNAKKLVNIPIPVPSRPEQQDIIDHVESAFSQLDTIADSIKNGLEQVAALRRSALAEAFAGRLVPQDPDDEPASALLKRIAASRPAKPKHRRKARA